MNFLHLPSSSLSFLTKTNKNKQKQTGEYDDSLEKMDSSARVLQRMFRKWILRRRWAQLSRDFAGSKVFCFLFFVFLFLFIYFFCFYFFISFVFYFIFILFLFYFFFCVVLVIVIIETFIVILFLCYSPLFLVINENYFFKGEFRIAPSK